MADEPEIKLKPSVDPRTKRPPSPAARGVSSVAPKLFVSSCFDEEDAESLKSHGITHILQVGSELSPSHPDAFTYSGVDVLDAEDEDLVATLPKCFDFIDKGRDSGHVLVHSALGKSRAPAVVAAYLVSREGKSLEEALEAVQAARDVAQPNKGFVLQLKEWKTGGCNSEGWVPWDTDRYLAAASKEHTDAGDSVAAKLPVMAAVTADPGEETVDCYSEYLRSWSVQR